MDQDSDYEPIVEYWVIAFFKSHSKNRAYYRQFTAAGFYEAFDIAMTFSEKTSCQILWYKEKRKCDSKFTELGIPLLESICTDFSCKSEFCSLDCKQDHFYFKHIR